MLTDLPQGPATEVDGTELVEISISPNMGQARRTGLDPNQTQGYAQILRLYEYRIKNVPNPEPANLVDKEEGIYQGVISEKCYKVDG